MGDRRIWMPLGAFIVIGTVVRLVFAIVTEEGPGAFDPQSFSIMAGAIREDGLDAYDTPRYPYPPGFIPWLLVATWAPVQDLLSYDVALRLAMIAADVLMVLLVVDYLEASGADRRTRLTAGAAIALGPVFLAISGIHGQFDSVAIAFGVAALWWWQRESGENRVLATGILIGLGAAMKTVPIFLLLALLPWVRSRGEAVRLVGPAVAIPFLALLPFLLANGADTIESLRANQGIPGFGGVSLLLVNNTFVEAWSEIGIDSLSVSRALTDVQQILVLGAVTAVGLVLWFRRIPPAAGASLVWLAVFVFNPNFAWHYLIWGIPFFLMAGFVRESIAFGLLTITPLVLFYVPGDISRELLDWVYTPLTLLIWASLVVAFVTGLGWTIRNGERTCGLRSAQEPAR